MSVKNLKILVKIPVSEEQKHALEASVADGDVHCSFEYLNGRELTKDFLEDADIVIGNIPVPQLKDARSLKWLQLNSAGADAYVKDGVLGEEISLTNATGAYSLAVSEHMIAMVFDLIRRFPEYHKNQAAHLWKPMGNITSVEGMNVLLLGPGDIGGAFARKMKALGAHVTGVRRTEHEKPEWLDEQYQFPMLDKLLPEADLVAMVLPGGDATCHVMDERRLRLMKKGAFLINVGRGNAIDPKGLYQVLMDGHLGGCALDVTEPEPLPEDDPLWDVPGLFITPHVAGNFWLQTTLDRIVEIAVKNLGHYVRGEELENQVDRRTGYKKS